MNNHEISHSKGWNLMATHGIVLFYIAANPDSTMRQMSEALSLTERRIAQVVRDLADAELIWVERNGRRNSYTVNAEARFQHPTLSHISLGTFVRVLSGTLSALATVFLTSERVAPLTYVTYV